MQTTLSSMWANSSVVSAGAYDDDSCHVHQDPVAVYLSAFLCVGLIISYLPQILRIIRNKSSQGFSPWFLLLGATSSASSFLNVVALQWGIVRCCPSLPTLECAESLLGIFQVGLQWLMFASVFVLFLIYYPAEQKYERAIALPQRDHQDRRLRAQARSAARRAAAERNIPSQIDEEPARLAVPAKASRTAVASSADDASSAGSDNSDLDSVDSHIAQNYTNPPAHVAENDSSDDAHDEVQNDDEDPESLSHADDSAISRRDASSSAFSRLAPAFWPMWKAPNGEVIQAPGRPGRSSNGRAMLTNAPRGMQRIDRQRRAKIAKKTLRTRKRRTEEWSLALALAWVVLIHFVFISAITLLLVSSLPSKSFPPPEEVSALSHWTQALVNTPVAKLSRPSSRLLVSRWAAFLGSSATLLAAGQYLPQIVYTARSKLVGSLSIPMMCLQVPGSAVFVYSLALQPGTDWSSLAAYVLTGVLQLVLLVLCVSWRVRQRRAGIDDYGRPLAAISL